MRKCVCIKCNRFNRLPDGWKPKQLVCGWRGEDRRGPQCGGQLRNLAGHEKGTKEMPEAMAEVPDGRPAAPPPEPSEVPADYVPGQLDLYGRGEVFRA